jgi:hypothetical protein
MNKNLNLSSQFSKKQIWSSPEEKKNRKSQFIENIIWSSPKEKKIINKKPQSEFWKESGKPNWFSPEELKKAKEYVEEFKKEYPNVNFERNANPNNESIYRLT